MMNRKKLKTLESQINKLLTPLTRIQQEISLVEMDFATGMEERKTKNRAVNKKNCRK